MNFKNETESISLHKNNYYSLKDITFFDQRLVKLKEKEDYIKTVYEIEEKESSAFIFNG
jgi:hypothetical protein